MPSKIILITEPSDSILRKLAMRLLRRPQVRIVRFRDAAPDREEHVLQELALINGELRCTDCDHLAIDEIWHAKNPAHALEECRQTTGRVLSFVRKEKIPVINYLSTLYVAGREGGTVVEDTIGSSGPAPGIAEECHLWNEKAIEQSGCSFRIFRIPLISDGTPQSAHVWARFVRLALRFKQEIEDRIPRYFTANPLRINLSEGGAISLVRSDDVAAILDEISAAGDVTCGHFHIGPRQPVQLTAYFPALAEFTGVRLQAVPDANQINSVDRLFGLKAEELLAYLNCRTLFSTERTMKYSTFAGGREAWHAHPKTALQDVLSAADRNGDGPGAGVFDWRSCFAKKQLLLPEGVALNYYVGGTGSRTLVLLNAYGQSFGYWEGFIQAVSAQARIILWVPRGNDGEDIGLTLASPLAVHAEDLDRVLSHEGVDACTLVAWCSGPKLALEYYSRYRHRVSSMVFVAASFKGLPQHKALETAYEKNLQPLLETVEKYPETAELVLEYLKGILLAQNKQERSMEELAAISGADLQDALSAVNVSLKEMVLHPFCAANTTVAYTKQMRDFWDHDFLSVLNRIDVPVLFVGGDCDRIASQAIAKAVAAMVPQAKYLEVKGGSHYIQYEQWDLLAQVVEDVVNSGEIKRTYPWTSLIGP